MSLGSCVLLKNIFRRWSLHWLYVYHCFLKHCELKRIYVQIIWGFDSQQYVSSFLPAKLTTKVCKIICWYITSTFIMYQVGQILGNGWQCPQLLRTIPRAYWNSWWRQEDRESVLRNQGIQHWTVGKTTN